MTSYLTSLTSLAKLKGDMKKMSQITVRNVDQDLKRLISQHAKEQGVSINQYMLNIAKEAVNHKKPQPSSWRECSGLLEFDDFPDEVMADFEKVDNEMWT